MAARAVKELWSAPRAHSLAEVELFFQVKVSISCTLDEKFWTGRTRSKLALLSYLVMRNLHQVFCLGQWILHVPIDLPV